MKKLLYITNIPTPYRQARFNLLSRELATLGIELEVLYMAKIEKNRNWVLQSETFKYNFKIYRGIHPTIMGFFAHFNPTLLLRLLKNDYQAAIVGGMASPTHWLAPFFIGSKKTQIMSIESNLYSTERKAGLGYKIKSILLKKADAYQVTGNPQIEYINFFEPISASSKKIIRLPNLVNESVFVNQVQKIRNDEKVSIRNSLGVSEEEQIWVLSSRLIEIKGVIPFINLFKKLKNVSLFILGDGELFSVIEERIKRENLSIKLVGFVPESEVVRYYAVADLFVLPSLKDPSPLSPIEALAANLPLLVSSRIGNYMDVINEGLNGWGYDPLNEKELVEELVKKISKLTRGELAEMGKRSGDLFKQNFLSTRCIKDYAKELKMIL
jgi:glycosyltransferase involved in cell wall biosynthesis